MEKAVISKQDAKSIRKRRIRKFMESSGIILMIIGFLMCINDAPLEAEYALSVGEIIRNTLLGIVTIAIGWADYHISQHGLRIIISWDD